MRGSTYIATAALLGGLILSAGGAPPEIAVFSFGTNVYPFAILEQPRADVQAAHPELLEPPGLGDAFAYRVGRGDETIRGIVATVVAANVLECADGPEIAIHPGDLRLDLLRALYLTDVLHRSPQTGDERPPLAPPISDVFEIQPAHP